MSIINIKTSYDIMTALAYQQEKDGIDRCAAKRSNIEPFHFDNFARMAIENACRKVQGYTIIQAFSPEELQNTPENVELVNLIGCELAARAFSGYPYQVITHTDSKSGHLHNHISVLNYDLETGKCINSDCRWLHLSRVNDKLMGDYGMEVCNARTRQADQKAYFDKQRNPDKYIWQEHLQDSVSKALDNAVSPGDFAARLRAEGVTAKINGKNGKPLKHMVFIFKGKDGKEHRKRGSNMNMGNGFTYKELTEVFKQNAAKAKALTGESLTPKVVNTAKIAGKQKDIELTAAISRSKKKEKEEEEKKRERLRIGLLEIQRKNKARREEIDNLQKESDNLNEVMDNLDDMEEMERLIKKDEQLQQKIRELSKECIALSQEEKRLNRFLDGRQMVLDTRLEMGLEIHKQKQNDNEGISLG